MKENKYFLINKIHFNLDLVVLEIENIYNFSLELKILKEIYNFKIGEKKLINIGKIFEKKKLKIEIINFNLIFDEVIYQKKFFGFYEKCMVETKNKSIPIGNLKKGDIILDKYGNDLKINNVYVFDVDNKYHNKIILLKKSNCGINLPYQNIIVSINSNLIIKNIILQGRSIILNKKATYYNSTENLKLYALETDNNKNFLLSGFIVESI